MGRMVSVEEIDTVVGMVGIDVVVRFAEAGASWWKDPWAVRCVCTRYVRESILKRMWSWGEDVK